jgi:formimidoylglutamate deiminase
MPDGRLFRDRFADAGLASQRYAARIPRREAHMTELTATTVWLPEGWRRDVRIDIDGGRVSRLSSGEDMRSERRWLLPGIPNLHSHAFQRAMAGFAERRGDPADSFWTWRETMYGFAARMTPALTYDIARQLYVEMLEAGYTWVCEFHYLHHQPDGRPYANPAEMSEALITAARDVGIGMTLLPVLYMTGGFDGRPLAQRQRRFGHDVDSYLRLVESLRGRENDRLRIGVAFHSLRAVPPEAIAIVLDSGLVDAVPIHIHIAEQLVEVQDCLTVRNARPVEWLLDNVPVDERWCLVHATHMTAEETRAVAASGATVAICPTTEGNLGDGLFPFRAYLDAEGAWGVGSDSHTSVSPVEELRWLEYGQRLATHHRNIAADEETPSVGETLLAGALHGGRASGVACGMIDAREGAFSGSLADFVVLDDNAVLLAGHDKETVVDAWLFAGNRNLVREVWVAGEQVVADGCHRDRESAAGHYRAAMQTLRS